VEGFPGGLLHPLLVPAHALAIVALGLLIGGQERRIAPLAMFALALAAGLYSITFAIGETPAPDAILATAAASGVLVALAVRAPLPAAVLAASTGVAIGLDSPPDAIALDVARDMLIGTWIGGCLALGTVVVAASKLARSWQRLAVR